MSAFLTHLKTILNHRREVRKACFKMGIPLQGLTHDLSKFRPREFLIYKFANGEKSPHAVMREQFGYSDRWMYHYHVNKHHWQYWLDIESYPQSVKPIKMPYKYVIEMFCDFVGAGKAYSKDKWTTSAPLDYWEKSCQGQRLMHWESEAFFVYLLKLMNALPNEKDFYIVYKAEKKRLKEWYATGLFKG